MPRGTKGTPAASRAGSSRGSSASFSAWLGRVRHPHEQRPDAIGDGAPALAGNLGAFEVARAQRGELRPQAHAEFGCERCVSIDAQPSPCGRPFDGLRASGWEALLDGSCESAALWDTEAGSAAHPLVLSLSKGERVTATRSPSGAAPTARASRTSEARSTPLSPGGRQQLRALRLEGRDVVVVLQRQADVVEAVRAGSASRTGRCRSGAPSPCPGRRRSAAPGRPGSGRPGSSSARAIRWSTSSCGSATVSRPIFAQLLRKMSANDGAMIALMPMSSRPHGACSREEPQPKFGPASEDRRALVGRVVEHEVRVLAPVEERERPEAGALDALQELLRHDLVGVDVRAVERDRVALTMFLTGSTTAPPGCRRSDRRWRRRRPSPG